MAGKNQSAGGSGPGIITRSVLGVNLISSGLGKPAGSEASLRMKVNGRDGFVSAFDGRAGLTAPSSNFTDERDAIDALPPDRPSASRKLVQQQSQDGVCAVRDAEVRTSAIIHSLQYTTTM